MFRAMIGALALAWTIGATAWGQAVAPSASDATDDDVFGLTRVHQVQVTVAAEDYPRMDPPPPKLPMGRGSGPAAFGPDAGAGGFGFEFAYVPAEVHVGDQTFANVGLRYKGNGSYMMSLTKAKRSLKVDFDRNLPDQEFRGHAKLNFNSGALDSTKVREALAYAVFRAAGVPAPRTAFAEVKLTVPGKYDGAYLGLYTVVEQVDQRFLAAHFGDGDGLLLKPEGIRGLPHFGDDMAKYEAGYNVKSKQGQGDWSRLVELTRLVNKADEAEFREKIHEYLDVDVFVRFMAANVALASLDGFLGLGHNYYLYLSPETGRFSFIPWDLDLAFGAFGIYGNSQQLADLSVDHPHVGENKLIDRLLAMPEVKAAYREQVRRLAAEVFTSEKLGADVARLEALAQEPLAKESEAARARRENSGYGLFGGMGGMFAALPTGEFIEKRSASIAAQLAGTKEGYVPRMATFGQPGEPGFGPGGRGSGGSLAQGMLDAFDADKNREVSEEESAAGMKRLFAEWDEDGDGALDEREIGAGVQKLMRSRERRR